MTKHWLSSLGRWWLAKCWQLGYFSMFRVTHNRGKLQHTRDAESYASHMSRKHVGTCDTPWLNQYRTAMLKWPNDLRGQGQWPPFSIPAESIPGCMFGAILVIPDQICDELLCGQGTVCGRTDGRQAEFPRILSRNGQNDLEGQCQWPNFQYQLRVSQDAYLVQICWFKLKSVTSYCVDKVRFVDGQTDGQTDAGNDNTPSTWKAKG